MEQILIYIVLGIGYLILKNLGKNKSTPGEQAPYAENEEPTYAPPQTRTGNQPLSLEELLERFDQAKQRAKARATEKLETIEPPAQAKKPTQPVYQNLEEEARQRIESAEYKKQLQEVVPGYARSGELTTTISTSSRVKGARPSYRSRRTKARPARFPATMLKNPRGLRQAMVLKEILDRKY